MSKRILALAASVGPLAVTALMAGALAIAAPPAMSPRNKPACFVYYYCPSVGQDCNAAAGCYCKGIGYAECGPLPPTN